MKTYLKNAKVVSVAPPATREQELVARRVDAEIVDYPTAQKVTADFDWATVISPPGKSLATPFAYVVPQGDQIWLNFLNLFVDTIKRDGRLAAAAERNNLGPTARSSRAWPTRQPGFWELQTVAAVQALSEIEFL